MHKPPTSDREVGQSQNKPFDPFEGRDREEVWQEIRENSTPISREEMIKQIRDATSKGKDNNQESGNE